MAIGDLFRRIFNLGKPKSQQEKASAAPAPAKFVGSFTTGDIMVSISEKPPDGQKVYTPNKSIDSLGEEGLRSLVQAIATLRFVNDETGKMSIEMRYSTRKIDNANREKDRDIINQEVAAIRERAIPQGAFSPLDARYSFSVSEDPTHKRIYEPTTPSNDWRKLSNDEKTKLIEGIIAYEKTKPQTGAGIQINMIGAPQAQGDIRVLYTALGGSFPKQLFVSNPPIPPPLGPPPPALYKPLITVPTPAPNVAAPPQRAPEPQPEGSDPKLGHHHN